MLCWKPPFVVSAADGWVSTSTVLEDSTHALHADQEMILVVDEELQDLL